MKRILIVEDEAGIYNFLKQGLEEEGYSIFIATDGEMGVKLFIKERPDLILLDWMLPKLTGIEFCQIIRKNDLELQSCFLLPKIP